MTSQRFFTIALSKKPLPILMSRDVSTRRSPLKYTNKNPGFSKRGIIYLLMHSSCCYNTLVDALAENKIFHSVANMKIISRFFESLFWTSLIVYSVSFCNVPYTKPFIHHPPGLCVSRAKESNLTILLKNNDVSILFIKTKPFDVFMNIINHHIFILMWFRRK